VTASLYVELAVIGRCVQSCAPCPLEAQCDGEVSDPVARTGYFQLSRDTYLTCLPPEACVGGNASSGLQCARGYTGVPCSDCDAVRAAAT
jgi:hypothetical protein